VKFRIELISSGEEEIVARVKKGCELTEKIEELVNLSDKKDSVIVYGEDEMLELRFSEIECFFIEERKVYAACSGGKNYRVKSKLYEIERELPSEFVRINKSAVANIKKIAKFTSSFGGAVNAHFRSGYVDYVSRRCLSEVKRRFKL